MKLNLVDEKLEPEYPVFSEHRKSRRAFLKKLAIASAVVVAGGGAWYSFKASPAGEPSPSDRSPHLMGKTIPPDPAPEHPVRTAGEMVQPLPVTNVKTNAHVANPAGGMPLPQQLAKPGEMPAVSQPVHVKGKVKAPSPKPVQKPQIVLPPPSRGVMARPQKIPKPSPPVPIDGDIAMPEAPK